MLRNLVLSIMAVLFFSSIANAADFVLTSPKFAENAKLPLLYSCRGKNVSPPLSWANPPPGTRSYALMVSSPDWSFDVFMWVVYNIPETVTQLAEGASIDLPKPILTGMNYFHEQAYKGPCPPDHTERRYLFTIYALDEALDLPEDLTAEEVMEKIKKHILKTATLTARFNY